MSISNAIRENVHAARLKQFVPWASNAILRPLFLLPEVYDRLSGPWEDEEADDMAGVRADLEAFTLGDPITATFKPSPNAYLKRLRTRSKDVWEIRIQQPSKFRLFGFFAEQDVFVGFELWHRDDVNFDDDIASAQLAWRNLFPVNSAIVSDSINAYISEKVVLLR